MTDTPPRAELLVDIPPDLHGETSDAQPLRCQQEGCTNTVTKPARGRTPKFCDEHKGTTPKGARKANWPMAGQVEDALRMYLSMLGAGVAFIDPFDGRVIAKGAPDVAHEIVELARPSKQFKQVLEAIALPGKYGPLAGALIPVLVPILAHHELLPQFIIPMVISDPELIPVADVRREAA